MLGPHNPNDETDSDEPRRRRFERLTRKDHVVVRHEDTVHFHFPVIIEVRERSSGDASPRIDGATVADDMADHVGP